MPLVDHRRAFVARLLATLRAVPVVEQVLELAWPLVVAHAAYESGWGKLVQSRLGAHNLFNISAGRSWKGRTLAGGDLEYRPGDPRPRRIIQQWRAYDSDLEGVRDYLRLLALRRYLPARAALVAGDATRFAELLGPDRAGETPPVGGYYTLPSAEYSAGLLAHLAEVRARLPAEMPPASTA